MVENQRRRKTKRGEAWRGEEATITRENYRAVSPFGKLATLSSELCTLVRPIVA